MGDRWYVKILNLTLYFFKWLGGTKNYLICMRTIIYVPTMIESRIDTDKYANMFFLYGFIT